MTEDELKPHLNPYSLLTDPVDIFEDVAQPVPPGTKAPPRPPGRERTTPELPVTEPFEIFTDIAIPVPPGTVAPPRPAGRTIRVALPVGEPAAEVVADLLQRVQTAIDGLSTDPANLEALRKAAAMLPRAG